MNLGRGFPVPQEKQIVLNGNFWSPATPEKPVVQRPDYPQPEMQQNQAGQENWQDLLGMYTGLLQEPGNGSPSKPSLNSHVGSFNREHNIQDLSPVVTRNILPHNFTANGLIEQNHKGASAHYGVVLQNFHQNGAVSPNTHQQGFISPSFHQNRVISSNLHQNGVISPNLRQNGVFSPHLLQNGARFPNPHQNGVVSPNLHQNGIVSPNLHQNGIILSNFWDHNMQNANLNQNAGGIGSEVQNLARAMAPQKVNSLAELLGTMTSPPVTNGQSSRSTSIAEKQTNRNSQSQGFESNQTTYKSGSSLLQQNHILQGNRSIGDYYLPQTSNIRPSVPSRPDYNLNFPPRSEEFEPSGALTLLNQLWPATPDQEKQPKNHQIIQEQVPQADEIPNQDKEVQANGFFSQQPDIVEKNINEFTQTTLGTSISTPSKDKNNFDGGNEVIDLNKTPAQKTPKRKKHRPKVVKEGKPKKTPKKPDATKDNTPDGKPRAKRKYVRRKGVETSKILFTGTAKEGEVCNGQRATKTCRRSLNFDTENRAENKSQCRDFDSQEQINERNKVPFDLNLASNNIECCAEANIRSILAPKEPQNILKQQTDSLYKSVHPAEQTPDDSVPFTAQPLAPKNHALNAIARSLSFRNANLNPSDGKNWYNPVHNCLTSIGQADFENLSGGRQMILHSKLPLVESSANITGSGSQKDNSCTELSQAQSVSLMCSQVVSNENSKKGGYMGRSSTVRQNCSKNIKKMRIENKNNKNSTGLISEITNVGDFSGLSIKRRDNNFQVQSSTLCTSSNSEANKVAYDWYLNSADLRYKLQQQNTSSEVHQPEERFAWNKSQHPVSTQSSISIATVPSYNQAKCTKRNEVLHSPANVPAKSLVEQKSPNTASSGEKVRQKETNSSRGYGNSTKKVKGSRGKKKLVSAVDDMKCLRLKVLTVDNIEVFRVDDITDWLKDLSINNTGKNISGREENALVPYVGDRSIVPFDPIKRRVPRPKVDLDPETNRLWNLLMGKEGNESAEAVDSDKQKWWEEERKVFRGRVDAFITRMHEVQGDRRFSKWKGSVVDSVVGVFLTQNVSDHLSSSAFMALAAKFPPKSRTDKPECNRNGEQNQVRVTFPDETIDDYVSHLVNGHSKTEEDIISSQSSSESFIYQASEDIRSSSGSNSETEEQLMGRNFNLNHFPDTVSEQAQRAVACQQPQFRATENSFLENSLYGQDAGVTKDKNVNSHPFTSDGPTPSARSWLSMLMDPEISVKECMSSLGSVDFGSTTETSYTAEQTGRPDSQSSLMHHGIVNKHIGQQSSYLDINIQKESTYLAGSTRPVEASCTEPSGNVHKHTGLDFDNQAHIVEHNSRQSENANPKPFETGQTLFSEGQSSKIGNATQNGRKRKAGKEKVEPFNWDILREQVESKNGPTGINVNAMDSLDYEALRNVNVSEISDAIKERGMNNMLAERIKAFLNRLVEDHGKVDLEWLRDVQPDKGKDYLLSIRGLGLKSVECVRLLTLHHLAFPVDTNVGRIAVRLGWVPLQPLPESLQLHLLEMYPVLESIQKYLWPRLCKLDQETLYELHYQMITFGKVFCTKREPNCNACPLRGECRHFASAFASARLALPAPEEKRIVMSGNQTSPRKFSDVPVKPMPLLQSWDNSEREREIGFGRNDEPIIEEPTTPEPPTEALERVIEDAFYEDPDDIPVIKLNLQEFTSNLQNFMQENMEMREFDVSKALVTLSPELASIPMPKLKHVSRLRTEHQVYVLPDSHPLLKGMDRRELDDPSPYLLAIWTPGETADSIQPPESKCSSLEGGPCNLTTCFSCHSAREANAQTVRGTILIPCRTAMRGSFPLNGTYFQVNELFADHESSLNPIDVPRSWLWNLKRRTVFFGTSVSTIFKGLSTDDIQFCFWKGFVCVRGFDRETRSPRPLKARLHFPASKLVKQNEQRKRKDAKKV